MPETLPAPPATVPATVPGDPGELAAYEPQRGLKRIAVAEAGEKVFRRARDPDGLAQAVEAKLTEQRRFIRWYDAQAKDPGTLLNGRDAFGGYRTVTAEPAADYVSIPALFGLAPADERGINAVKVMLSRWRGALKDDDAFAETLADALLRVIRICEQEKLGTIRGTEGTGEFELYTPAVYIEAARQVLGEIDLDPATNEIAQRTVRAARYFTALENGLAHDWHGRVWLNPPYHRELLPAFVDKLVDEIDAGRVDAAVMLTNNCTDTHWFRHAARTCQAICFTAGRIGFIRPAGQIVAPTQGQAFFYYGADAKRFAVGFGTIGFGALPGWPFYG